MLACLFRLRNPHRAFRKFADVDNSDWHDYFSFCEFPRRISLGWLNQRGTVCCPRLVGVTAACAMCSALDACITLYRYTIRDNVTNGRISWRSDQPCTRYGGRDRGESGESAARMKYHSHGIPCPVMSSLVSASCTPSTGLYRVLDRLSSRKYTV